MISRALSVLGALVVLLGGTASAGFWTQVYAEGTNRDILDAPQAISSLYNPSLPGAANSDLYLQIPMGNGFVRMNGQQVLAVITKAWQLNDKVAYEAKLKFYMSPQGAVCGSSDSCTNILGDKASFSREYYANGSYYNARLTPITGPWYGAYTPAESFDADCSYPASTGYVSGNTSMQQAIDNTNIRVSTFWQKWSTLQTISCNSFARFINENTIASDLQIAFNELDVQGVKVSPAYVTLVDYTDPTSTCTTETGCDTTGGTGGGTPGAGTGGTTTPPCVRADGTTSGNPYDCAPSDNETNCGIIDIPCNLKKLFIPSPDFLQQLFSIQNVTQKLELPFVISDSWTFTLFGQSQTLDWTQLALPDAAKTVIQGLMWYGIFFWLLDFFGLPNPYGNKRGNDSVGNFKHFYNDINNRWTGKGKKK